MAFHWRGGWGLKQCLVQKTILKFPTFYKFHNVVSCAATHSVNAASAECSGGRLNNLGASSRSKRLSKSCAAQTEPVQCAVQRFAGSEAPVCGGDITAFAIAVGNA